jgi:hypothetical protein
MKTFYASALLVDNKIMFWKVSQNLKSTPYDFYRHFYYANINMKKFVSEHNCEVRWLKMEENEQTTNAMIFDEIAPNWFKQWGISEFSKGNKPYEVPK